MSASSLPVLLNSDPCQQLPESGAKKMSTMCSTYTCLVASFSAACSEMAALITRLEVRHGEIMSVSTAKLDTATKNASVAHQVAIRYQ